jgi:hypothetical protein
LPKVFCQCAGHCPLSGAYWTNYLPVSDTGSAFVTKCKGGKDPA